jgi:hypothetical protein
VKVVRLLLLVHCFLLLIVAQLLVPLSFDPHHQRRSSRDFFVGQLAPGHFALLGRLQRPKHGAKNGAVQYQASLFCFLKRNNTSNCN